MRSARALVFPGLVPLAPAEVAAAVSLRDHHLELAAEICGFDPAGIDATAGSEELPSTVHEALLAVAVIRLVAAQRIKPGAVLGLSAGCITALLGAGALNERDCFRLIHDINTAQIAAKQAAPAGWTYALLPSSPHDAEPLLQAFRRRDPDAWLSVDLGDGLIAVSTRRGQPEQDRAWLARMGVALLSEADRPEHCPYALPPVTSMQRIVARADIRPAVVPVVSPLTGQVLDNDPAAYRQMLVEQWYDTACLTPAVQTLAQLSGIDGVDFIGPARSVYVTRLRTLAETLGTTHQTHAIAA